MKNERYLYVAGVVPDEAYRCECGACWNDQPAGGECTYCGSAIYVRDWEYTSPLICWARLA